MIAVITQYARREHAVNAPSTRCSNFLRAVKASWTL